MVPALLFLLLKKLIKKHWHKGITILLLVVTIAASGQENLKYKITRDGEVIGWTTISRITENEITKIILQSEVKARFFFQFNVFATEEVTLRGGVITHTAQFRKMNGDVKENKEMRFTINGYEVYKGSKIERLPFTTLNANILSLYFQEPLSVQEVYSDKFQKMIAVKCLGNGKYKLKLPDGNSSTYHYRNGNCIRVEIDHSFYSAEMNLSK
ncbi:MAG TPA: DUF6134 family protein [Chitinophagaceae bacterium]|nr:DUF6134 family protein [Chitinophagaceae bacterium]